MSKRKAHTSESVDALLKSLLVLSRAVDRVLGTYAVSAAVDGMPLSLSKVQVLRLLAERGPTNSTRLARFLDVSKPAVTQIIDAMQRDKLVKRTAGRADRREVTLALTGRGQQAIAAVRRHQRRCLREVAGQLGKRDMGRCIGMLQEMAGALTSAGQAYERFCLQCGAHADGTCVLLTESDESCPYLEHELAAMESAGKKK